jgi:hypothetical protein
VVLQVIILLMVHQAVGVSFKVAAVQVVMGLQVMLVL